MYILNAIGARILFICIKGIKYGHMGFLIAHMGFLIGHMGFLIGHM